MRVIILQDGDGYVHAFEYTNDSLRALLELLAKENNDNTILEEEPPADLITRSADEIEAWISDCGPVGRSGGNLVNFARLKGLDEIKTTRLF